MLERSDGEVIFVGIAYDTDTKVHTCKIEKMEKSGKTVYDSRRTLSWLLDRGSIPL